MKSRALNAPAMVERRCYDGVMVETVGDGKVTRPRLRPVSHFLPDAMVEFPRDIREDFPIGTRFRIAARDCQKHWADGTWKGRPYLQVTEIGVIVRSIPDPGVRAKIKPGAVSGRAYYYVWDNVR